MSYLMEQTSLTINRIDNPLRDRTYDELAADAREFAHLVGAEEGLCEKAIRVAYDPPNWRTAPDLTSKEIDALTITGTIEPGGLRGRLRRFLLENREESFFSKDFRLLFRTGGFWYQPRPLRLTVIALCFSAIVQGFVQSVTNGANQTMPQYFQLQCDTVNNHGWVSKRALWQFSILNAITYLVAGIIGMGPLFHIPFEAKWAIVPQTRV